MKANYYRWHFLKKSVILIPTSLLLIILFAVQFYSIWSNDGQAPETTARLNYSPIPRLTVLPSITPTTPLPTSTVTPLPTPQPTITEVPEIPIVPPAVSPPPIFSKEFWSRFLKELVSAEVLAETLLGIFMGVLFALLRPLYDYLRSAVRTFVKYGWPRAVERVPSALSDVLIAIRSNLENLRSAIADFLASVVDTMTRASRFTEYLIGNVLPTIGSFLGSIWSAIRAAVGALQRRRAAQKWYEQPNAVDPGLIEVALAITAVVIALPALGRGQGTSIVPVFWLDVLRSFSVAIPTVVSINLINLYSKDKGSQSKHVLLGPLEDGPFFLLAWCVIIGFIVITISAFG